MSSGDVKNHYEKLARLFVKIGYTAPFDPDALCNGDPDEYVGVFRNLLQSGSNDVRGFLLDNGYELFGLSNKRLLENIFRIMRNAFNYRPKLTIRQFLQGGFGVRKLEFTTDLFRFWYEKHVSMTSPSAFKKTSKRYRNSRSKVEHGHKNLTSRPSTRPSSAHVEARSYEAKLVGPSSGSIVSRVSAREREAVTVRREAGVHSRLGQGGQPSVAPSVAREQEPSHGSHQDPLPQPAPQQPTPSQDNTAPAEAPAATRADSELSDLLTALVMRFTSMEEKVTKTFDTLISRVSAVEARLSLFDQRLVVLERMGEFGRLGAYKRSNAARVNNAVGGDNAASQRAGSSSSVQQSSLLQQSPSSFVRTMESQPPLDTPQLTSVDKTAQSTGPVTQSPQVEPSVEYGDPSVVEVPVDYESDFEGDEVGADTVDNTYPVVRGDDDQPLRAPLSYSYGQQNVGLMVAEEALRAVALRQQQEAAGSSAVSTHTSPVSVRRAPEEQPVFNEPEQLQPPARVSAQPTVSPDESQSGPTSIQSVSSQIDDTDEFIRNLQRRMRDAERQIDHAVGPL